MKRKTEEYRPIVMKYNHVRSRKLLDSSRDQICTLNFHGCNYDTQTTIAAHAGFDFCGKGTGIKASDVYSVDSCSHCHDVLDGRKPSEYTQDDKDWFFWRAFVKTNNRRIEQGLIKIMGQN